jgi:plastocyanin
MVRVGVLLLVTAAALASAAGADTPVLQGSVGPGFSISLTDSAGSAVTHLDPGAYAVHVVDQGDIHNFHLVGPGVDQATSVAGTGEATWTVTLADGTYRFFCDAHPTQMKGSFTVGTPPPPPPAAQRLKGSVGPGLKIAFAHAASPGRTKITIRDLTAQDDFHLVGPGVNKKTGIAFKGTVTWTVTLKVGKYAFRSDAHRALRGTLTVS